MDSHGGEAAAAVPSCSHRGGVGGYVPTATSLSDLMKESEAISLRVRHIGLPARADAQITNVHIAYAAHTQPFVGATLAQRTMPLCGGAWDVSVGQAVGHKSPGR